MIILGGGIIGLTIAWQLTRKQTTKVRAVIQSDELPAASEVAVGMLAPISEALSSNTDLLDIGVRSLHLYHEFLSQLQAEAPTAPGLSSEGTLLVAEDYDGLEWLRNRYSLLQKLGADCHWLDKSALLHCEPSLSPSVMAGVRVPIEREILVSRLCDALRSALHYHRVEIIRKRVTRVAQKESWTLTLSDQSVLECDSLIIAGGAWLERLHTEKEIDKPIVVPNKGQVVAVIPYSDLPLKHMIRTRHIYVCPKTDGSIRLGASSEFIGFNNRPTVGNVREILRDVWKVLPALDDAHFVKTVIGFRPMSKCGTPIVEKGNRRDLYWAVGHGRSGVLLAPWTGRRMEQIVAHDRR